MTSRMVGDHGSTARGGGGARGHHQNSRRRRSNDDASSYTPSIDGSEDDASVVMEPEPSAMDEGREEVHSTGIPPAQELTEEESAAQALPDSFLQKVQMLMDELWQDTLSKNYFFGDGCLAYSNVTMDIDALTMYTDADIAHLLPKSFPQTAMWQFPNLISRTNIAQSSRAALKFNGHNKKIPRASPKVSRKAKQVPLHWLPNAKLATCLHNSIQFHLNVYWINPSYIGGVSYFEKNIMHVIVQALNVALVNFHVGNEGGKDVPQGQVAMSREAAHAVKFQVKDETKGSNQESITNRFSNAAAEMLLEGFVKALNDMASDGSGNERTVVYAKELSRSAMYGLTATGTTSGKCFASESAHEFLHGQL